jgi:hypothetical protein
MEAGDIPPLFKYGKLRDKTCQLFAAKKGCVPKWAGALFLLAGNQELIRCDVQSLAPVPFHMLEGVSAHLQS